MGKKKKGLNRVYGALIVFSVLIVVIPYFLFLKLLDLIWGEETWEYEGPKK